MNFHGAWMHCKLAWQFEYMTMYHNFFDYVGLDFQLILKGDSLIQNYVSLLIFYCSVIIQGHALRDPVNNHT